MVRELDALAAFNSVLAGEVRKRVPWRQLTRFGRMTLI